MKKILALLLCALMLTPAFLSCSEASGENSENSGSQAEQNETESEVAETELSDDLPEVDYEGNDFTILSLNYFNRDSSDLLVYDEFTGDPINDTLFEARTNVEDRFNVVIEVIDSGDVYAGDTAFRNSVVGGDDSFDLYLGNDHMTMALGKEGLCLNLMDVEQFNMEKP